MGGQYDVAWIVSNELEPVAVVVSRTAVLLCPLYKLALCFFKFYLYFAVVSSDLQPLLLKCCAHCDAAVDIQN